MKNSISLTLTTATFCWLLLTVILYGCGLQDHPCQQERNASFATGTDWAHALLARSDQETIVNNLQIAFNRALIDPNKTAAEINQIAEQLEDAQDELVILKANEDRLKRIADAAEATYQKCLLEHP